MNMSVKIIAGNLARKYMSNINHEEKVIKTDTLNENGKSAVKIFLNRKFNAADRKKYARTQNIKFSAELLHMALQINPEQEVFNCLYSLASDDVDVYDCISQSCESEGDYLKEDAYVQQLYYAVYHKKLEKDEIFKMIQTINDDPRFMQYIKSVLQNDEEGFRPESLITVYDNFCNSEKKLDKILLKITFDEIVNRYKDDPGACETYLTYFLNRNVETARQFYCALSNRSKPDFRRILLRAGRSKNTEFAAKVLRDAKSCYELREHSVKMAFNAVIYEPKNREYVSYISNTEEVHLLPKEDLICFLKAIKAWIDHNPNDLKSLELFDCLKSNSILHLFTKYATSSIKDAPAYKVSWPQYTTQHVNDFLFLATPALFEKRLEKIKHNSLTLSQSTLDFYEAIAKSENLPKQMREHVKEQAKDILTAVKSTGNNYGRS